MSFKTARYDIESRFATNFTTTTILFENDTRDRESGVAWVRLTVNAGEEQREELGTPATFLIVGLITVQIFVPEGGGAVAADDLVDQVSAIFREQQFGIITCDTPTRIAQGVSNGWYQVNVSIPFEARTTH